MAEDHALKPRDRARLSNTLLLRLEAFDRPRLAVAAVADPVVEPVLAVLPELERVGHQPVAAPVRWARDLARMRRVELGEAVLERLAGLDRLALRRHGRGDLAPARPRSPVGVRLLGGDL